MALGEGQVQVQDAAGAVELLRRSSRQRQKAPTGLNTQSSRSHSVFGIALRWRMDNENAPLGPGGCAEEAEGTLGSDGLAWGRLSIVDLAGAAWADQHSYTWHALARWHACMCLSASAA